MNDLDHRDPECKTVFESAVLILEEYVFGHFFREERAMKASKYTHYETHKRHHKVFRDRILDIVRAYRGGELSVISNLPHVVSDWLLHHIAHEDMKLKLTLDNGSVDTRPLAFLAEDAYEEYEFERLSPEYGAKSKGKIDFSKVSALVCEQGSIIRRSVREALKEIGITQVEEASNIFSARNAIISSDHQIVILNHKMDSADMAQMLQSVRTMEIGRDPFVLAMMVVTIGDEATVKSAVNSGADTVLLTPFSPEQFKKKLMAQVECRRPFVVTRDYVGPERRAEIRTDRNSAIQIPVPNPVLARGQGIPADQYESSVRSTTEAIGVARLKSMSAAIGFECNRLLAGIRDGLIGSVGRVSCVANMDDRADQMHKIAKGFDPLRRDLSNFRMLCEVLKSKNSPVTYVDAENLLASWRRAEKENGLT